MKIVIGIATTGRSDQLTRTLHEISLQIRKADLVIICPATPEDVDLTAVEESGARVHVVQGPRGICAQRNTILRGNGDADVIVFMDDDFYPAKDYLQEVEALFEDNQDIVIATNQPLADGAAGPGISHEQAITMLSESRAPPVSARIALEDTYGGYGCNMSVRMSVVLKYGVLFDEQLPLYGWLEDIDFSRRLARYGRIVASPLLRGVHLATKRGRLTGKRLGYSQVANPIYMIRKGTMRASFALPQLTRNFVKNAIRSVWPEPWIDRRGRLLGNILAFRDLFTGRLVPSNILKL